MSSFFNLQLLSVQSVWLIKSFDSMIMLLLSVASFRFNMVCYFPIKLYQLLCLCYTSKVKRYDSVSGTVLIFLGFEKISALILE